MAFRLLAFAAVGLWALAAFGGQRPRLTPIMAALLLFLATVVLATFNSPDPGLSVAGNLERMDGLVAWVAVAGLAMAVSSIARDDSRRALILGGLIIAGIGLGVIGLGQVLSIWPLQHQGRASATIGNADFLGVYALFQAATALMLLRLGRLRRLAWLGLAFACVSLIDSGSRAAVVGGVVGIAVALVLLGGFWRRTAITVACAAIVTLGVIGALAGFARLGDVQLGQPAVVARAAIKYRLAVWQVSLGLAFEHPVIGTGENSFPYLVQQTQVPAIDPVPWFDRAHSWPIDRFVDGGLLGLAAYIGIFVAAFVALRRRPEGWIWTACLAAYLADNAFGFDSVATYAPLALVIGLIDSCCDGVVVPRFAPAVVAASVAATLPLTALAAVNAADIMVGIKAPTATASLAAFHRVFDRGGPGQRDARNLLALHAIATRSQPLLQDSIKVQEGVIGRRSTQARDMLLLAAVVTAADGGQ